MSSKMLSLDYGKHYVGMAISNNQKTIAFARKILDYRDKDPFWTALKKIIQEEKIESIVLGWPLSMEGKITNQTLETEAFLKELEKQTGLKVEKMDERLTSLQARKSGGDHSTAAQILLQVYLDRKNKENVLK